MSNALIAPFVPGTRWQGSEVESSPPHASVRRGRIAVITPWHPEPVDNGSKQRLRQLLAALADDFDLVLISLLADRQYGGGWAPPVPGVWRQYALSLPAYRPRSPRALLAALHPLPRSFAATWDRRVAATIGTIVERAGARVALGADLRVLHYLLTLPPSVSCLLDEASVSPFVAESDNGRGLARWRAHGRQRKYVRLLRRATRRLDAAILVSAQEVAAYRRLVGNARVALIENGVGGLPEPAWHPPVGADLLYTGALTYAPNAEAVAYFAQDILPRIERMRPEVRLLVTGAVPETAPPGTAHPRVVPTGWLDADGLAATYRRARACVVPLLAGTGTRIKILEALALGIPVVSTAKGAEGLDLVAGEEILIADTPADFAAATARLLSDDAFAAAIGARGRERARRDFTWETRGRQLRTLVAECLAARGGD